MISVLASGADERYGLWLLNLIGSVHANSRRTFDAIVLYDLGLSRFQRRLAARIRDVELRTVPAFVPHWREGRTWKAWIWRHLEADRVVWLDAGITVLRPLGEALDQVDERGYFVVSQRHPVEWSTPSDYWALFGADPSLGDREAVAAGILGFRRPSRFFDAVVIPTYEDCLRGHSVGFSAGDEVRNYGLDYNPAAPLRDCRIFRHEQTVLNLRFYQAFPDAVVNDMKRWAGTGPGEHPEQIIWAHRRRGDFRYLPRVPYRPLTALVGIPFGIVLRACWWLRLHGWLFRAALYRHKATQLARWLRRTGR